MCKVGILLIGLDLYHSASTLFQSLILHKTGSPFDLAVHLIALLTLLMAYRGRVKRSIAGKVVFPVMMVNLMKQLMAGHFVTFVTSTDSSGEEKMALTWSFFNNSSCTDYERLMVVKSLLFCGVMFRIAFQGDDSCVGKDEWFPWQNENACDVNQSRDGEGNDKKEE